MKGVQHILLIVLLAITVNSFVYFSFANTYSTSILNYQNFISQFHSGIYQYRILSGYFLIGIYDALGNLDIDYSIFKLKFLDENSEPRMYLALYLLNSFFTILSAMMLYFIGNLKEVNLKNSEKILYPTLAIFVIALSQFVLVPYDCSSYFFILLFAFVILKYIGNQNKNYLVILSLELLVSTINRESSAISIALAASLLYLRYGFSKKMIIPTFVLIAVFSSVYLGVRLFRGSFSTNDGMLLFQNFTEPKNLLGITFSCILFSLCLSITENHLQRKAIYLFHFLAMPYLFMCFYTGIMYEIRLYIPLFLTSLVLSRINFKYINN